LRILVGRWGLGDGAGNPDLFHEAGPNRAALSPPEAGARSAAEAPQEAGATPLVATLQEAGANLVATTLLETRQQIVSLLPVLVQGRNDHGRNGDHAVVAEHGSSHHEPRGHHAGERERAAGAPAA
jgi:hypothetical protein